MQMTYSSSQAGNISKFIRWSGDRKTGGSICYLKWVNLNLVPAIVANACPELQSLIFPKN